MSVSSPGSDRASLNWSAGVRGLVIALALFGMSSTAGWAVYPAGSVLAYTIASPFGLAGVVGSRRFFRKAMMIASTLMGFAALFVWCAFLVNAPVATVSVMGGVAMLLLLVSAAAGTILHAVRLASRKCPVMLASVEGWLSTGREKLGWIRLLVALQLGALTSATTDR